MRNLQKVPIAVLLVLCALFTFTAQAATAAEATYQVNDEEALLDNGTLTYVLTGTAPVSQFTAERFSPFRVVMDINRADFTFSPRALPANDFVTMKVEDLKGENAPGRRFIFTLADSHDYKVKTDGNKVRITFSPAEGVATKAATLPRQTELTGIDVVSAGSTTKVFVKATDILRDHNVGTLSEQGSAPRMFIDIPNVNISGIAREKVIQSGALAKIRTVPQDDGVRVVFQSSNPQLFKYDVAPVDGGLLVTVDEKGSAEATAATAGREVNAAPAPAPEEKRAAAAPPRRSSRDQRLDKLISSSEKMAAGAPAAVLSERAKLQSTLPGSDDFGISGYEAQRITVDFYKIDIHNVFRLFREISNMNIIVDENVQGSLTLALNDVPWDFALDIILNLMQLKKEERFNTIVIYPAEIDGKPNVFTWPKNDKAQDTLTIKPDMDIIQKQENQLVIENKKQQSAEILQAKQLLSKAQMLEKQDNLEDAVLLLDEAAKLWPQNTKISNRLAAICLVNLGQNAKAAHYAEASLKQKPKDRSAALYAAIANANMKRLSQANEYFIRSISGKKPMKEALLSYAAFSENNGMHEAALKLIGKFKKYYGENLNTMIATARIYDKLGQTDRADTEYRAILTSGYQISPDLRSFIQARLGRRR